VFGYLEIDLRRTEPAELGDVEVHISGICGQVDLLVPVAWTIQPARPIGVRPTLVEEPYDASQVVTGGIPVRVRTLGIFGGTVLKRL